MSANEESKKRGLPQQDDIGAAIRNKRAALNPSTEAISNTKDQSQFNVSHSSSVKHYFKILCPQSITGIIIGRGGSTISQMNTTSGCGIKLSHNNEYFPGTNDRILLLNGTPEALQLAIDAVTTKIAEAAEKKYPTEPRLDPFPPNRNADGHYLVRVLIPRSSEGAMIGKGGSVVRQMTAETGCNFQLGDENDQYGTNERIFSLTSPSVQGVVLGVNAVMHTLITSPKIRGYVNPGTAYGQEPSSQMGAPVPYGNTPSNGYAPAPLLAAPPGMVPYAQAPAPAPAVMYAPPQPHMQYAQAPPQMAVPVPMQQQVGAYSQTQPAFPQQQQQGGNYQYTQGQPTYQTQSQGQHGQGQGPQPVRHAGGPNGRGSHGGATGSNTQGQGQKIQHQQGGHNKNQNRYQQNIPAAGYQQQPQQQQQPAYAQQAPAAYQQQQPQSQVAAGQYPSQHQPVPVQGQPQYLYPSQPVPGMAQQQQQTQQPLQQQLGKMTNQQQQAPQQQQQVYGAPPAYQQQQQPQYGAYPSAGYTSAVPSQQQQLQQQPQQQMHMPYAAPVQGAQHAYAAQPQQQQQQQYLQYGQQALQQQPVAGVGSVGAPQQYVYGAPAVRK